MANEQKPQQKQQNEGEGNKTAARRYNKDQQDFVKEGQVDRAAKEAREALDSDESEELEQAEELGRSHAREADANKNYARQSKLKE